MTGRSCLNAFFSRDPFPIDPNVPEETHQLTVRALVVGAALGCIGEANHYFDKIPLLADSPMASVGASNVYLGLKTGFTFGPQLFGVRA